jgi:hypothetical protein
MYRVRDVVKIRKNGERFFVKIIKIHASTLNKKTKFGESGAAEVVYYYLARLDNIYVLLLPLCLCTLVFK